MGTVFKRLFDSVVFRIRKNTMPKEISISNL